MSDSRKRTYSEASYDSITLIQSPISVDISEGTPGNVFSYTTTEAIEVIEVGILLTEAVLGDTIAGVITSRVGTTDGISHSMVDGSAIATSQGTVGSQDVAAGGTVIMYHLTKGTDSGTQSGQGIMYLKFIEKYTGA
jgi:hypothetical protein